MATQVDHESDVKREHDTDERETESKLTSWYIAGLVSIKLDAIKYLPLKFRKQSFVLYQVEVSLNTDSKTTWNLYLKYSDIYAFHQKLEFHYNRSCKFNPNLKSTLFLPKMPPKKQWQRNKFDKKFIEQRICLLNVYMMTLIKYVSFSTRKTQDLFLRFLKLDSLYKYVVNNDTEILSQLQKHDSKLLTTKDDNNSNLLHYITCSQSTKCMQHIQGNKALIKQLLHEKDQFHWTPLQLAKHVHNEQIYNTLNTFADAQINDEKDEFEADRYLPAQYAQNVTSNAYKRKFWVIINPKSGKSEALTAWQQAIKPFFDFHAKNIEYDVLQTTKQYHAQEAASALAADHKYDAIVVLGGDGTIAEIINGLYYNKSINNYRVCVIPIAVGSGNALATELAVSNVVDALRKIKRGFVTCIDAYLASQINESDTYSFVSSQWGVISAIDLESEYMRFLGAARFTLKALSEIAYDPIYRARIYFKPQDTNVVKQFNDDLNTKRKVNNDEDWWKALELIDFDALEIKQNKVGEYPSDWICVEAEFELLCVTNLQAIDEDNIMGGKDFNCRSNALRLVYNEKKGRMNHTNVLLAMETGKHLDLEYVKYYDVDAVVIEPLSNGPPMDVDGERKPLKPLYVKLLPSDFVVVC